MDKKMVVELSIIFAAYFLVALFVFEALKMGAGREIILWPAVFSAIVTGGVYLIMKWLSR